MKLKVYFVILHYQNVEETVNCVNSILELYNYSNYILNIIVVDNCSPNRSGNILMDKYKQNINVDVVINKNNGGFAYGNNIGYSIAKDNKADYIVITNNDTIFFDKLFVEKLISSESYTEIIAPDIINIDGYHQNPIRKSPSTIKECKILIKKNIIRNCLLSLPYIKNIMIIYLKKYEAIWYKKYYGDKEREKIKQNFVPYGATIIYTKKWINKENIAFIPLTFMYCEEDTLAQYCKKNAYSISYNKNLKLTHLEGKSIESSTNGEIDKTIKRNKMINDSLKKYIKYIKEEI